MSISSLQVEFRVLFGIRMQSEKRTEPNEQQDYIFVLHENLVTKLGTRNSCEHR